MCQQCAVHRLLDAHDEPARWTFGIFLLGVFQVAIPRQRLQLVKDGSMVSKLNWICVKLLSFAEINTSTLVNLDGIEMIQLNDGAVQVAKESDIADVMQRLPN